MSEVELIDSDGNIVKSFEEVNLTKSKTVTYLNDNPFASWCIKVKDDLVVLGDYVPIDLIGDYLKEFRAWLSIVARELDRCRETIFKMPYNDQSKVNEYITKLCDIRLLLREDLEKGVLLEKIDNSRIYFSLIKALALKHGWVLQVSRN